MVKSTLSLRQNSIPRRSRREAAERSVRRMNESTSRRGSLIKKIVAMGVIPLLALSAALSTYMAISRYNSICSEVFNELKGMCVCVGELVSLTSDSNGVFTGDEDMFDSISARTGIDITLFEGDTRSITTVRAEDGARAIGTKASQDVADEVLASGRIYYSDRVEVNGTPYFGYYMPLHSIAGDITGMAFAGKSRSDVEGILFGIVVQSLVISGVGTLIAGAFCVIFARRIVRAVNSTALFLNRVADGDTECPVDARLTSRDDEIGSMGRSAVKLQRSLRSLISTDPLTGLYNRRACNIKLEELKKLADSSGCAFSLALGDIDLFKQFNDRYGHACGDEVLKDIARILERCTDGGMASRWGGEEFLIAFGGSDPQAAYDAVQRVMEELSEYRCEYAGQSIPVTMTFGTAQYNGAQTYEELVNTADERLYYGKNHGRNRVVTELPEEETAN